MNETARCSWHKKQCNRSEFRPDKNRNNGLQSTCRAGLKERSQTPKARAAKKRRDAIYDKTPARRASKKRANAKRSGTNKHDTQMGIRR